MPVYVDDMRAPYGRMKMCHMIADSVEELLRMADTIGVNRRWFQCTSHPHFDIALSKRALALQAGAITVNRKELVAAIRRHRTKWMTEPDELAAIRAAKISSQTHANLTPN